MLETGEAGAAKGATERIGKTSTKLHCIVLHNYASLNVLNGKVVKNLRDMTFHSSATEFLGTSCLSFRLEGVLGASWEHLGRVLGPSWTVMVASWGVLWPSWAVL